MENLEKQNLPLPPTEENLKHIEELERKKQAKRENRLKKIVENNFELLQSLFPEEASDFEITYNALAQAGFRRQEGEF